MVDSFPILSLPVFLLLICYTGVVLLSKDLDKADCKMHFVRILQPCLILFCLLYLQVKHSALNPAILFSACFNGLVIAFTLPVLYHLSYRKEPENYTHPFEFSFGLFTIVFLVSAGGMLSGISVGKTILPTIVTATEILFLIPSIFHIAYYFYYGKCVNEMAIQAIYATNKLETREFIKLIPLKTILLFLAGTVLFTGTMYGVNRSVQVVPTAFSAVQAVLFFLSLFLLFCKGRKSLFLRTRLMKLILQVKDHNEKLKSSHLAEGNYPESLILNSPVAERAPGTILLVIGESANRLHMKAFSDYSRETTPWLSGKAGDEGFFLFPHAYASWIQTPEAVRMALTNTNQYCKVKAEDEISIINIANKLGFKTWWYSAQGYSEEKSSEVTVIAEAAREKRWLMQEYSVRQHDEKLLQYLERVDNSQNNFVVIHLEGSHVEFQERYPDRFEQWPADKKDPYGSNPYDNSILYTDHILSQIFDYASKKLHLQAMLYFSDHGSLIGQKRKSFFSGFEDTRIPFFLYLSDTYRKLYPQTAETLRIHESFYFTNDLIFDLLCGLFQIDHPLHKRQYDISSSAYQFTKETLRTNLGKTSLSEDAGD